MNKPIERTNFVPEEPSAEVIGKARQILEVSGKVASNVKIIVGGKIGKILLDLKKWLVSIFEDKGSSQKNEKPTGRARQALGDVANNVNVIASGEVERRMEIFTEWLSDNIKSKKPSDFTPHEKEAVIQKIEDLNGITYPLGRLFHGIPNHIQTLADLDAQARKAFRNGIK